MDGAFHQNQDQKTRQDYHQEARDINRDFKRVKNWGPLEQRTFRFKSPALNFFCPLCRTERAIATNHRLSTLNYIQVILLTAFTTALAYPLAGLKTIAVVFPIWLAFEAARRLLFSREVPCPHCGFDASWYKRDVKVARKRVAEFWAEKEVNSEPPAPQ